MKRLSVHTVFALLAAAAAAAVVVQGVRLQQARSLSADIVAIDPAALAAVPRDAPREVRLAQATALSATGAFDAAFKGYSGLIEPGRPDDVGRQALYNLGNMYLRQGLNLGTQGTPVDGPPRTPEEAGPLIELAKQRYRDLLRAEPQDWDARYNLERALRAAPEEQEIAVEETQTPVERRNVMLRGMKAGDLP